MPGTYQTEQFGTALGYPHDLLSSVYYRDGNPRKTKQGVPGGLLVDNAGTCPIKWVFASDMVKGTELWQRDKTQLCIDPAKLHISHLMICALSPRLAVESQRQVFTDFTSLKRGDMISMLGDGLDDCLVLQVPPLLQHASVRLLPPNLLR